MNFFTISGSDIASTTAYMGDIFDDVKPLFFLIVGLIIGLWILGYLFNVFLPKKGGMRDV